MNLRLAKIVSAVFHPLLVPTYTLLVMINLQIHSILVMPLKYRYIIVVFVFLTTFVLPSIVIFILLKVGKIKNLEMDTRQERTLPMIIIAVAFYGTYYFLKQTSLTGLMALFMAGATVLVLICLVINYITKISLHMTAWGGMFGVFLGFALSHHYNLLAILFSILLVIGIVGTSRLKLNVHTPAQVYSGFVLGAGIMVSLFYLI
ncbi:MAG: hypothetical protein CL661_10460 [Bacteroidetes bacterium]|nr:hypothetical protein [Bacteroidota bacterium]